MGYQSIGASASNASSAAFRTWGSAVSGQLSSLGLVRASDPGQINWTTVTAPIVVSTSAGFEIWQFADALATTAPIYIKVEYGAGASILTPAIWVTVGGGTNGAGTVVSGVGNFNCTTARTQVIGSVAYALAAVGLIHSWGDYDLSAFGVMPWPSLAAAQAFSSFFGVERLRDPNGNPSPDGWVLYTCMNGAAAQHVRVFGTNTAQISGSQAYLQSMGANGLATTKVGTKQGFAPILTGQAGKTYGPSRMVVAIGHADQVGGASFAAQHMGEPMTFISGGSGLSTGGGVGWGNTTIGTTLKGLAMRGDQGIRQYWPRRRDMPDWWVS